MTIDPLFFASCYGSIREMRAAGLSDTTIAGLLVEIRAAAIQEERFRMEMVIRENPPMCPTWVEMRDAMPAPPTIDP